LLLARQGRGKALDAWSSRSIHESSVRQSDPSRSCGRWLDKLITSIAGVADNQQRKKGYDVYGAAGRRLQGILLELYFRIYPQMGSIPSLRGSFCPCAMRVVSVFGRVVRSFGVRCLEALYLVLHIVVYYVQLNMLLA
jgi:hypothetical protein